MNTFDLGKFTGKTDTMVVIDDLDVFKHGLCSSSIFIPFKQQLFSYLLYTQPSLSYDKFALLNSIDSIEQYVNIPNYCRQFLNDLVMDSYYLLYQQCLIGNIYVSNNFNYLNIAVGYLIRRRHVLFQEVIEKGLIYMESVGSLNRDIGMDLADCMENALYSIRYKENIEQALKRVHVYTGRPFRQGYAPTYPDLLPHEQHLREINMYTVNPRDIIQQRQLDTNIQQRQVDMNIQNRDDRPIYQDKQNVHNSKLTPIIHNAYCRLAQDTIPELNIPVKLLWVWDTGNRIQRRQTAEDCREQLIDMLSFFSINYSIKTALGRIFTDPTIFGSSSLKLKDIFQRVWNRIQSVQSKDTRTELINRLKEELSDMSITCATGHASRLVNVLNGFPEVELSMIDFGKEIKQSILYHIEQAIQEKDSETQGILLETMIAEEVNERKPYVDFVHLLIPSILDKLVNQYKGTLDKPEVESFVNKELTDMKIYN